MLTIQQWISVLTLFISFCVAVTIYSLGKNQSFNQAPGYSKRAITKPRFWSFAGVKDLLRVFRSVKNGTVLSYLDSLWSRYGDTYVISFFGTRIIFTRDAVNIKHILAFQWLDYDATKGIRTEMFKDVAPGTIASVDGKAWEDERRKWRRSLTHHHQLLDLPFLEKSFRLFLHHIPAGNMVDLQPLVLDMMTDIVRNFVIGESAHRLDIENQSKETRESVEALERLTPAMAMKGLLGPLSWLLPRGGFDADCRLFKGLLHRTIQEQLKTREGGNMNPQSNSPLQSRFLDRLSLHTNDPETLRNDVTAALMASESTARPLSHSIWLLSQHPKIYEKLRQSVLDVVGLEEPTFADLNKFPYLISVLNEALRLLPPTTLTLRRANKDTWLPSGGGEDGTEMLLLHKGERVVISIYGAQRDPANFGKDASEFKPERWEHLSVNTLGFLAFSMGPRLCAGRAFVYHILTYLLVRFVQTNSSVEGRDDAGVEPQVRLSMTNKNGVWVALNPEL